MNNLQEKNIYSPEVFADREARFASENKLKQDKALLKQNLKGLYAQAEKDLKKGTLTDERYDALTNTAFPKEFKEEILSDLDEGDLQDFEEKGEAEQRDYLMGKLAESPDDFEIYEFISTQSSGLKYTRSEIERRNKQNWVLDNLSELEDIGERTDARIEELLKEPKAMEAYRKGMRSDAYEDAMARENDN